MPASQNQKKKVNYLNTVHPVGVSYPDSSSKSCKPCFCFGVIGAFFFYKYSNPELLLLTQLIGNRTSCPTIQGNWVRYFESSSRYKLG